MDNITDILKTSLGGFTLGHILSAIVTLLLCLLVVKLIMKLARRLISRARRINDRLQKIILTSVKAVLYVLTAIITAEALGVNTTSLTAIMSVLTLGVTLAAEDILGNMAGGLVILSSRPFGLGDVIESGSTLGTVQEISLNHTKVETADGQIVMLPNKELSSSRIINYSTLGRRRVVHNVTASYDAPTETVKAAPEVYLVDYGASSIEYSVRCWTATADYWAAFYALNENLRTAFAAHGVEMTYNHLNVHVVEKV